MTANGMITDLRTAGQHVGSGAAAGFVAGLLIGGVGGRLAMFVLRLTSGDVVHGVQSDDDFEMGQFTSSTVFLLGATAILGAFCGVLFVGVRPFIARSHRLWASSLMFGLVGGALVIEPGGVDFTLVEPHALAVALFIAIPAVFGLALAAMTERFVAHAPDRNWWLLGLLPVVLLPLTGVSGLAVLLVLVVGWLVGRYFGTLRALPSRFPAVVTVRVGLVGVGGWAAFSLARDVAEIL